MPSPLPWFLILEFLIMQYRKGDKVDLKTPGQTRPEGRYEVVDVVGRRVVLRDAKAGRQLTVDPVELIPFHRPGKIDWP